MRAVFRGNQHRQGKAVIPRPRARGDLALNLPTVTKILGFGSRDVNALERRQYVFQRQDVRPARIRRRNRAIHVPFADFGAAQILEVTAAAQNLAKIMRK